MSTAAWLCYVSPLRVQLSPLLQSGEEAVTRLLPLGSKTGWYSEDFSGELPRSEFSRTFSKLQKAGVHCSELSLNFQGHNLQQPSVWVNEFVFWAATLARPETILKLLPETWFRWFDVTAIHRSIGIDWVTSLDVATPDELTGLCRFNEDYLRAVHSVDMRTLAQTTMHGQNRLMLRFGARQPERPVQRLDTASKVDMILKDLVHNQDFLNLLSARSEVIALVRGDLGAEVASNLLPQLNSTCWIIRLSDLPTDQQQIREGLFERYETIIKSSMALLLLPFDDYDEEDYSPPKDSILDHPHWLSLALMVAHSIAEHSRMSLVMLLMPSIRYFPTQDDVVFISCPAGGEPCASQQSHVALVHAVEYVTDYLVEAGFASRLYFGYGWKNNAIYQHFDAEEWLSQEAWGCPKAENDFLQPRPMVAYLHVAERHINFNNFWQHLWEEKMPPSLMGVNLLVSMPGSGQSYVRFMLELMTQRPTRGVEMYYTITGKSLGECFPEMAVNVSAEPIVWVAHSLFEAAKLVKLQLVTSLVVLVRNYASLWLRLWPPSTPAEAPTGANITVNDSAQLGETMRIFVASYLADLNSMLDIPEYFRKKTLVVYYEELQDNEGSLPPNLLHLWHLERPDTALERRTRLEQLRLISENCDEFHLCEHSACRNLKAKYGTSKHRQRSAPKTIPPERFSEILDLEEMLCAQDEGVVNTFLLREHWGSGHLKGCSDGKAIWRDKTLET